MYNLFGKDVGYLLVDRRGRADGHELSNRDSHVLLHAVYGSFALGGHASTDTSRYLSSWTV